MSVPPEGEVPPRAFFYTYQVIKLLWMVLGAILVIRTLRVWAKVYNKLTPVVQSYILVFIADIMAVLIYLPNAILELTTGVLYTGSSDFWYCALSAYLTVASCVALNVACVCISCTVVRMLNGTPVSDRTILRWGILSWLFGFGLASIFAGNHLYGSYKGLYCMLPTTQYRFYATAPLIVTIFVCFSLMCNNYWIAYSIVRSAEQRYEGESENAYTNRASKVILRNGMSLIGTFYISWFLVFLSAVVTAVGGTVPMQLDAVASLLAKFQPVVDSIVLYRMLQKIAVRYTEPSGQVAPLNEGNKMDLALKKLAMRLLNQSPSKHGGGDIEQPVLAS